MASRKQRRRAPRGREATQRELACLERDLELVREDLLVAAEFEKKAREVAERRQRAREKAEAELAEAVRAARSLCQKARGKGPRTKAKKACVAAEAESQRRRSKVERARAREEGAREALDDRSRRMQHLTREAARIVGQITAEKQRQKRVELREKRRARLLQLLAEDEAYRKRTPIHEQVEERPAPPGKRRYSEEDRRMLAELCEVWMRGYMEPCAAANMGGAFVHRYCESHDVDGQVRIGIPFVPDAGIDVAEEDIPPDAPLVFADLRAVVGDFARCINRSVITSEPVFMAEAYYQVGWMVSYARGTEVASGANLFLPAHLSRETGQMVDTYVVASHWMRGEFALALALAPDLLRRDDGRGYLDVNHASGEPVGLEFFFNVHWGPEQTGPMRVATYMDIWSDMLEVYA